RVADFLAVLVRPPYLEARRAGHAVAQRTHFLLADLDRAHEEELDLGHRAAVELLDDLPRVRALNLEPIRDTVDRLTLRIAGRAIVLLDLDLVLAGLGVELDPVRGGRAADEHELVLLEVEENAVADHVAAVAARHELLGAVDGEIVEAVDREIREELESVLAFDVEVHHVVRLIEQHAGVGPGPLLIAPVAE